MTTASGFPWIAPCCIFRCFSPLAHRGGLHPWEAEVIRQAGAFADRLVLASNPAVQACGRMRLPAEYLYVHRSAVA